MWSNGTLVVRLSGNKAEEGKRILASLTWLSSADNLAGSEKAEALFKNKEKNMSVLINSETRVICQGITGSWWSCAKACLDYGTEWWLVLRKRWLGI